ncbi:hypothetical protein M595_0435 [Lyngbya aestuarii BL J]|uniref:Cell division protein FtsL n=1 Tax=Lyngbya aestuarii BL J TaxID=1348334 RepID=U7QNP4_9CYAN|nr:hypothetical protein [Lyngbya aestuarii]ERT09604.1 hypothetical protein M595_0435 [Lyngbya aestuarii BL J]
MTTAYRPTRSTSKRLSPSLTTPTTPGNIIPLERARLQRKPRTQPLAQPESNSTPEIIELDVVEILPPQPPQPLWLRSLTTLQQVSSIVTGAVVGITLSVYSLTAYRESAWTQEYQTLEHYRTQEQQLRATNEVLKHQIAEGAQQPNTGLVEREPLDMIFLRPAPPRPEVSPEVPPLELNLSPTSTSNKPLGY